MSALGSATASLKKRHGYTAKLNLVSLMDIFTILVFFLLLNSGDSQNLEKAKFITLPDSSSTTAMHGDLMIVVSDEALIVDEQPIALVADILKAPDKTIEPLAQALKDYLAKRGEATPYEQANGYEVTILGDQSVPYALLKTVMTTCNLENFRDISLAVNQVAGQHNKSLDALALASPLASVSADQLSANKVAGEPVTPGGVQ